jgi:hypothetical protein
MVFVFDTSKIYRTLQFSKYIWNYFSVNKSYPGLQLIVPDQSRFPARRVHIIIKEVNKVFLQCGKFRFLLFVKHKSAAAIMQAEDLPAPAFASCGLRLRRGFRCR